MRKRRRTIKNDVTYRDLSEQKERGDERQLKRCDTERLYRATRAERAGGGGQLEGRCAYAWASEVGAMSAAVVAASHGRAVGEMNDVVRSGVIRALSAETIGANGAIMRGR